MEVAARSYILGLDLGIASCGWAVVEIDENEQPKGIIDCGVRAFDAAENPKNKESLALARRTARLQRRLIRRRAARMQKFRRLIQGKTVCSIDGKTILQGEKILDANHFDENGLIKNLPINTWQLRADGLTRRLSAKEWAAVLQHLLKHRGFRSMRKSESKTKDEELGKLLSGIRENHQLLAGEKYQTPAEIAIHVFQLEGHIRNKSGQYNHSFNRLDILDELNLLFEKQKQLGNPYVSGSLKDALEHLLWEQKPALAGDALLKMLGYCTFEEKEYKAAKATYSAERFIWLTKLNNLRIVQYGEERPLNREEREKLINQPYEKAKFTYKQVRQLLKLPENAIFKGLRYKNAKEDKAEDSVFMEMKAYHAIRKAMKDNGLENEWQEHLAKNHDLLDQIGQIFSVYKTDEDIKKAMDSRLPENILTVLLKELDFKTFIRLSQKALSKILPLMEQQGMRYDEACAQIYGAHDGKKAHTKSNKLPPIDQKEVRNPVVLRTFSQTRKVINAIIRHYGLPCRVHIETGRELGKSKADRNEIEKMQKENHDAREAEKQDFQKYFGVTPNAKQLLAWRLYQAQQGQCLYSGCPININRLLEDGYVEIDHALPFSRTWDDSFNNKVLVLKKENQNKGNRTPYEYLDGANNSERWQNFEARLQGCCFSKAKKHHLATREIQEKEFIERNLNDTRYVTRLMMNHIEQHLELKGKGEKRVFATRGRITALLRHYWGLNKDRDKNDRHHAMDAIVIACTTPSMQQKITTFFQDKAEYGTRPFEKINTQTGEVRKLDFPKPWQGFRKEVIIRVFSDDPKTELLAEKECLERFKESQDEIKPLLVSRPPKRTCSGEAHEATIRSHKKGTKRIKLIDLKKADLDKMVNRDREKALYEDLKARLEEHGGKGEKAFAEPFKKKGGTLVRSISIEDTQKSGLLVRNGIANNGNMVRTDVFKKSGKFYLVPVYIWQLAKNILPNKAIVGQKDESDWLEMDDTFEFLFSLYKNDYVKVKKGEKVISGYFNGTDRATGSISLFAHDKDKDKGKNGEYRSIGVQRLELFEKYEVDVLGEIRLSPPEKRQNA